MLKERYLNTGFGDLNIAEGPDNGPLLMLFHGFTNRWQTFMPFIDAWIDRYHLVAFDHSGHGKSFRRPEGYNAASFYEDAEAVFTSLAPEPALLVGHSMGGSMALYLAKNHPERCRAVVTGDTSVVLDKHIDTMNNRRNGKIFAIRRKMAEMSMEQLLRRGIPPLVAEELDQLDPRVMDDHAVGNVGNFFAGTTGLSLADIRCPLLFTQADPEQGGILQDAELQLDIADHPNRRFVRFNTGHDLLIHQGEDSPFFKEANRFLEDVLTGRFREPQA